jgi:hypothetical protein
MTKYEILLDTNKSWDKTLAHFTELFSLRKAYCNNKAANSRFKSTAHVCDHSSARSVTTANTKSNFTRDLYIESLKESLAAAWEYCALDATKCTPDHRPLIPSCFYKPNLRSNASRYQTSWHRTQVSWQHSPRVAAAAMVVALMAAGAKAASASVAVGTKPHGKRKKLFPNCNKVVVHDLAECFSLKANKDKRPTGWGTKRRD